MLLLARYAYCFLSQQPNTCIGFTAYKFTAINLAFNKRCHGH